MMREIKFRAWNESLRMMIGGKNSEEYLCASHGTLVHIRYRTISYGTYEPVLCKMLTHEQADKWELMQFTGLLDRNGIEIYEGDILHCFGESDAYIVYDDGGFCWKEINWWDAMVDMSPIGKVETTMSEVVGNIYENPELLKETK